MAYRHWGLPMRRALLPLALLAASVAPAAAQTVTPYRAAAPITPGTPVPSGDGVALACSAPGTLRLVMQNGSFLDFYALQGTAIVDNLSVTDVNAAASNAVCNVTVLRRY